MKSSNLRKLQLEIKNDIARRGGWVDNSNWGNILRRASKILPWLANIYLVFFLYTIYYYKDYSNYILVNLFSALTFYVFSAFSKEAIKVPSVKKRELGGWYWEKTRREFVFLFFGFLLVSLSNSLSPFIKTPINYIVFVLHSPLIVFLLILGLVFFFPRLYVSTVVSSVGTVSLGLFWVLTPFVLILLHQYITAIISTMVMFGSIRYITTKYKGLSIFQVVGLYLIGVEKIFLSLRSFEEEILDQIAAKKVWLEIDKKLSSGEKEEFLRLIIAIRERNDSSMIVKKTIGSILAFLVPLFLGLILEDIVYIQYIKPFLCSIKLFSCN